MIAIRQRQRAVDTLRYADIDMRVYVVDMARVYDCCVIFAPLRSIVADY